MLLRHPVCLLLNTPDLGRAIGIVRDFRSSTHSVLLGYSLWTSQGPNAVRTLDELVGAGLAEILVDTRLWGEPDEVYEAAIELMVQGIRGLTVAADTGPEMLAAVRQAADDSRLRTYHKREPLVLGRLMATPEADPGWGERTASRLTRENYTLRLLDQAVTARLHGLITGWSDLASLERAATAAGMPLLAPAQCPAADPDREWQGGEALASPADLLERGIDTVLYDVVHLLGHGDMEWASDRLEQATRKYAAIQEGG